jgi:single-strand DNA-binding protein
MGLPIIHNVFRVVEDPELRFTPSGKAVANIRLVCNDRKQEAGQWVDGDPFWVSGTAWEQQGENLVNSVHKGDLVVVTGKLKQRTYTTKDGVERMVNEIDLYECAPSLKYAEATIKRIDRRGAASAAERPAEAPPAADTPPF